MKEIKVKMIDDITFMQVHEKKDATHVVLELSTYHNLMRLVKEKAIQARGLAKSHSGYKIINVSPVDEPHAKTRMPDDKYLSFDINESAKINDPIAKLDFLEKRKATKKVKVPCYLIEIQSPYKTSLTEEDLKQVMFGELFKEILPKMGFENQDWPKPNVYASFTVEWKKEDGQFVLGKTVYRILLCPGLQDELWHLQVFATAIPTSVPEEIK